MWAPFGSYKMQTLAMSKSSVIFLYIFFCRYKIFRFFWLKTFQFIRFWVPALLWSSHWHWECQSLKCMSEFEVSSWLFLDTFVFLQAAKTLCKEQLLELNSSKQFPSLEQPSRKIILWKSFYYSFFNPYLLTFWLLMPWVNKALWILREGLMN